MTPAFMNSTQFKIQGFSTALFSTWIFVEELNLLFDAGDGLTAALMQKAGKIKYVFISHPDRDHVMGLFQFNQLNGRAGFPKIYYPKDSGSFPAIANFTQRFDPHTTGTEWHGINVNDVIKIKDKTFVRAFRNEHINSPQVKSLSFIVEYHKAKLKSEYRGLTNEALKELSLEHGRDYITKSLVEKVLGYAGDTPIDLKKPESYAHWDGIQTLIHEATFLNNNDATKANVHKHSSLDEVFEMVTQLNIGRLVLSHFSTRYSAKEIDEAILANCKRFDMKIPVCRILPGRISRHVLKEQIFTP